MSSAVGPRVAELLNLPQLTYVKEFRVESGRVRVVRDMEDEDEVAEAELPALVTVVREITVMYNESKTPHPSTTM